jgi:hypothetical protein
VIGARGSLGLGVVALGLTAGCSVVGPDGSGTTPVASAIPEIATPSAAPDARLVVDPDEADVVLYVSNQSFEDDPVRIVVEVDGRRVVDQQFAVEGQHTWVEFGLDLTEGEHTVLATSDTEARAEEVLVLPEGERRWAVLEYWFYPDDPSTGHAGTPRSFTFTVSDEPVGFA